MIQTETTESGIEPSSSITVKVCIQGGAGAFHEIAARHWFEQQSIQIVPALTFSEMVDKVAAAKKRVAARRVAALAIG